MGKVTLPPFLNKANETEATKTTLPLLATVLAGFSVTIIAQLIIQPKMEQVWPIVNYLLFFGLLLLALAVLFFLTSALFAIQAQAHDYSVLSPEALEKALEKVEKAGGQSGSGAVESNRSKERQLWELWHNAAKKAFILGVLAFTIGIIILYWNYLGNIFALICIAMVIACILWSIILIRGKARKIREVS